MHCRLLVPDLLPPEPGFAGALGSRRFPKLESLLARGRAAATPWDSLEQWLLEAFSVERQADWPSAPYALLGEGRAPGDDFWVHATPVHLRAERDSLLLADSTLLKLSQKEAGELAASISAHFAGELAIEALSPVAWYARLASPPSGPTLPFSRVAGRPVLIESTPLPWHALMNELQMLLHEHPVNEAREERGALTVNGIWLWGGGRLREARSPGLRSVASDMPLALGLAAAAGIHSSRVPLDAGRWLEHAVDDGVHLVVLSQLVAPRNRADAAEWASTIEALEQSWFAPLVEALERGRVGMVSVYASGASGMVNSEATRNDLRHFWRRRQPLARYAQSL